MTSTGNVLRELHRIHQQLTELRQRMDRGPKQVHAREANVARIEAELVEAKAAIKAAKVAGDQKQLQLKSGEGKIADLMVKLNQASSNREYQALKDQIAADEMANSVLADEILEGMERIDALQKAAAEVEKRVAQGKAELSKAQEQVRGQEESIAADIARLEGELKESEKNLPLDYAEPYHRMVRGKGADALAMVEGENCGGCYQNITANMFSNMLLGKSVVLCQTCGRLLYLPEERETGRGR